MSILRRTSCPKRDCPITAILISPLPWYWQSLEVVCRAEKDGAARGTEGERHSLFPATHSGLEGAANLTPWRRVVAARARRDITCGASQFTALAD